mmetsp:Transcript_19074/g.26660  ORF Transcript_19074/g.26660 Transcript_19074/m.26660 type:complete len:552 (-) Transcript_19074:299-1954(-)|eukprot:CAMPEP_0184490042 /NCGR_PEP_ID=MMETSP0113_2-20130426/16995_1 /TAXON_ID=91329 /ORGANISM="Norrisiella sphaerica, Strain BC52" /LENGTH=551 /DNA_ID=CAMNT_0026873779 /DNA_START=97 /DNA_END=1752 /DNA_ORIENTATION=+
MPTGHPAPNLSPGDIQKQGSRALKWVGASLLSAVLIIQVLWSPNKQLYSVDAEISHLGDGDKALKSIMPHVHHVTLRKGIEKDQAHTEVSPKQCAREIDSWLTRMNKTVFPVFDKQMVPCDPYSGKPFSLPVKHAFCFGDVAKVRILKPCGILCLSLDTDATAPYPSSWRETLCREEMFPKNYQCISSHSQQMVDYAGEWLSLGSLSEFQLLLCGANATEHDLPVNISRLFPVSTPGPPSELSPPPTDQKSKASRSSKLEASIAPPTIVNGDDADLIDDPERIEDPSASCDLVFNEDFDGPSVNLSTWAIARTAKLRKSVGVFRRPKGVGRPRNKEEECYSTNKHSLRTQDGMLVLRAVSGDDHKYPYCNYTSGRLHTRQGFTTGLFQIRAKYPKGNGIWPAIWMEAQSEEYGPWPLNGEIDISEIQGSRSNVTLGSLHYSTSSGPMYPHIFASHTYSLPSGESLADDFHTYGLLWEFDKMTWFVDDVAFASTSMWMSPSSPQEATYPAPFDRPFRIVLNLAIGGVFDGNVTPETQFPAEMKVDFVRVFKC